MVSSDTRNNAIVLAVILSAATLTGFFIVQFSGELRRVATNTEHIIEKLGDNLVSNISELSNTTEEYTAKTEHFINNISDSNKQAIKSLTTVFENYTQINNANLDNVTAHIHNQTQTFIPLLDKLDNLTAALTKNTNATNENTDSNNTNDNTTDPIPPPQPEPKPQPEPEPDSNNTTNPLEEICELQPQTQVCIFPNLNPSN